MFLARPFERSGNGGPTLLRTSLKQPVAHIDFESRSTCDLRSAGADRYAADLSTGVWCLAWALDEDPVRVWYPGDRDPHLLLDHIEKGGAVAGWNISFERVIWQKVLPRMGLQWPTLKIEQCDDTMARAYARALPGKLEQCAVACNLPMEKDAEGYRLMLKMCVPKAEWKKNPAGPPVWHDDDPEKLQRLGKYCARDVEVERALAKQLAPLTPSEREIWLLDRTINDRGFCVDTPRVTAALAIVDKETARLTDELRTITKGAVTTAKSIPKMLGWLESRGVQLKNLRSRPVSRLLRSNAPLSDEVRRVLQIRLEISRASTAKLKAMLASQEEDRRCRGMFSYHVATTGRWAGRRIQPQNFPRPVGLFEEQRVVDQCLELFQEPYGADLIRLCWSDPMPAIAYSLRGLIVPDEGKTFVGGDFTGIENRMLMWIAGEDWMLDEFRKFDRGEGVDNYKLTYSRSFNVPIETVTGSQRLIGKVSALASGYSGAVGAFLGMGDIYNVVPSDIARATRETCDPYIWRETAKRYPKEEVWRFGLDEDTWTGIRIVVDAWRNAHPNVVQLWWALQDAAIDATLSPGQVIVVPGNKVRFVSNKHFLFTQLPSKRCLAYARPEVREVPNMSGTGKRLQLNYWGQGKKSKKFEKRAMKPSILAENVVSGTSRDILTDAMKRVEHGGFPIVLHIHDEIVAEVDRDRADAAAFHRLMLDSAPWLGDMPVASKTWVAPRFIKD